MPAPKLSIVIPALGKLDRLENSLLSVLENRPSLCEVLVVVNDQYDDPYCLEGEVRFVAARYGAGAVECANVGIAASRGAIVHLLACGATVRDGWAEPALAHFTDPHVGAVAPLVVAHHATDTVWAAGIAYQPGGKRELCHHGDSAATLEQAACPALGPTLSAAFYRRAALDDLTELLCPGLGEAADVDLALRLQHADWQAVFEPACVVVAEPPDPPRSAWQQALHLERLFWRHFGKDTPSGELAAHAAVVLAEFGRNLPHPRALSALAARFVGACQRGRYRIRSSADGSALATEPVSTGSDLAHRRPGRPDARARVEAGHGLSGPHDKASQSSPPRATLTRSGLRYCRGE